MRAAVVSGLTAAGGVDHAAMNGDRAAVRGSFRAADARAGVILISEFIKEKHTCGVQCAGAAGLGVDSQAVAGSHHNALFRVQ